MKSENVIGSIDDQCNIFLYLGNNEIKNLPDQCVSGVLIKSYKTKSQGTFTVYLNDERKDENGFGIGINDKQYWEIEDGFHLDVFLGSFYYDRLINSGKASTRQRMLDGSDVFIYDRSKLDSTDSIVIDDLEFYRDRKNGLSDLSD